VNQERHLRLSVHKVDLPSSLSELVSWTRHRFHAVTTLRSISSANSVTLHVGAGLSVHLVSNSPVGDLVTNDILNRFVYLYHYQYCFAEWGGCGIHHTLQSYCKRFLCCDILLLVQQHLLYYKCIDCPDCSTINIVLSISITSYFPRINWAVACRHFAIQCKSDQIYTVQNAAKAKPQMIVTCGQAKLS